MSARDAEAAARFRAVLAYAGLKDADAAELLDVSPRHLGRLKAGERTLTDPQKVALVEHAQVPGWFLEYGFRPPADIRERLDRAIDFLTDPGDA